MTAEVNPAALTPQDKACTNCAHYVCSPSFENVVLMVIERTIRYMRHCSFGRITETLEPVTGKVTVKVSTVMCERLRNSRFDCGVEGINWTPSKKWKNDKKNCFKILVNTEK